MRVPEKAISEGRTYSRKMQMQIVVTVIWRIRMRCVDGDFAFYRINSVLVFIAVGA